MDDKSKSAIHIGLTAAALTIWLIRAAFAEDPADKAWRGCSADPPDITSCTAVLERGSKESTTNRAIAFYNRGLAYFNKVEYDRAIANLSEAIHLKPDFAEAFNNRGIAYIRKGEYDQALADLNEAIHLKPDYVKAFLNRGGAYYGKDELDRALSDLNEAIRLKPDYAKAFLSRSQVLYAKGEFEQGQEDHAKAIGLEFPHSDETSTVSSGTAPRVHSKAGTEADMRTGSVP